VLPGAAGHSQYVCHILRHYFNICKNYHLLSDSYFAIFDSHIRLEMYSLFDFSDLLELPSQQFELVLFHCKLHDGW